MAATRSRLDLQTSAQPAGSEISERSEKFYRGVIKWNMEGFEDEAGTYVQYGQSADSGPPTPNPPYSWMNDNSDRDDDRQKRHDSFHPAETIHIPHEPLYPSYIRLPRTEHPVTPHPGLSHLLVNAFTQSNIGGFDLCDQAGLGAVYRKTLLRDGLFLDLDEVERARSIGRLEGLLIGQWYAGAGLSLEESYKLVGVSYPDGVIKEALKSHKPNTTNRPRSPSSDEVMLDLVGKEVPKISDAKTTVAPGSPPREEVTSDGSPLSDVALEFEDCLVQVLGHTEPPHAGSSHQKKTTERDETGHRESNTTPVNASSEEMSKTIFRSSDLTQLMNLKLRHQGGSGSDSDSDRDKDKSRKMPRGDHDDNKKRKKKDGDSDEEGEGGATGTGGGTAGNKKARNGSKQGKTSGRETSGVNRGRGTGEKGPTKAAEVEGEIETGRKFPTKAEEADDEEKTAKTSLAKLTKADDENESKEERPITTPKKGVARSVAKTPKTPAKKAPVESKATPKKKALVKNKATPKKSAQDEVQPTSRRMTSRQYAIEEAKAKRGGK